MPTKTDTNTNTDAQNQAPAGEKRTRASRNNHAAAEMPITNSAQAQAFVDAVTKATANDEPNSQYNNAGFVTPARLRNIPLNGLRGMGILIAAEIASRVSTPEGPEAIQTLGVFADYSQNASVQQERSRQFEALRSAASILNPTFKGTPMELVNHHLKSNNTTWEKFSQNIRVSVPAATA